MHEESELVENSDRLTRAFGGWPSFHDAEVISMDLWRGDVVPKRNRWVLPTLTAKIRILEATQPGAAHAGNDTAVTLRFHDIEALRLGGFNHQNAIYGLALSRSAPVENMPARIDVEFEQAFGVDASFRCSRIEVIDVQPFSET